MESRRHSEKRSRTDAKKGNENDAETFIPLLDISNVEMMEPNQNVNGSEGRSLDFCEASSSNGRSSERSERCVSLNTQILNVLDDLDQALEKSLNENDSDDLPEDQDINIDPLFEIVHKIRKAKSINSDADDVQEHRRSTGKENFANRESPNRTIHNGDADNECVLDITPPYDPEYDVLLDIENKTSKFSETPSRSTPKLNVSNDDCKIDAGPLHELAKRVRKVNRSKLGSNHSDISEPQISITDIHVEPKKEELVKVKRSYSDRIPTKRPAPKKSQFAPDKTLPPDDPEEGCSSITQPMADPAEEPPKKPVACRPAVAASSHRKGQTTSTRSHNHTGNNCNHGPVMCESRAVARRDSMRHLRHLPLPNLVTPSAPPQTPPPDENLPLPVLLFMETHSPEYSPARHAVRPQSADSGPRVIGRRAMNREGAQRSVSLHVSPSRRRSCRTGGWRASTRDRTRSSSASSRSRTPRSLSSDSCSISSDDSSAINAARRANSVRANSRGSREESAAMPVAETSPLGTWPHKFSSMLACLGCTIGIFNISRFAIFSIHFGANFIVQFLVLSLIMGIPLFMLYLCLGEYLCSGPVDMWKISPLFQGVGIALLIAQSLIGIYSIIGISWLFVYFRDSFITKMDRYRWAEPFGLYRDNIVLTKNGTFKLSETVPDYFNGVVLNRHYLNSSETSFGNVKFQLTFNLVVVWMIVFVSLSKGLRSYGKVVYVFSLLPIFGTLILCAKLLTLSPHHSIYNIFPETSWNEFFINNKSWAAAAQESFLTWGLLGACVIQLSSHNKQRGKSNSYLKRDSALIILLTLVILLLSAFLANTCLHILHHNGYKYTPGSFEHVSSYTFLKSNQNSLATTYNSLPERFMPHHASLIGTHISRPGVDPSSQSGYQVLQLATELVPSTLAIIGPDKMSSFWAVLFYFILIMFGVAQQLAIWHCVITGIMAIKIKTMKSWETTVTFFSCAFGLTLGLPMTTDAGIQVVHFLDYVIVGGWWHCLLYVILICALFLVRGRPYAGDTIVTALYPPSESKKCTQAIVALLSFTWNVVLPIAMIALCVIDFRVGKYRQLYVWNKTPPGFEYWGVGCKKLGAIMQLLPILVIPVTGFVQTWRYLSSGPPDILERIQSLYRPTLDESSQPPEDTSNNNNNNNSERPAGLAGTNVPNNAIITPQADPPPKYTPPPSYSTATGARIAKMLRQSLRRSIRGVRRLANTFGEPSSMQSHIPMSISESVSQQPINDEELPPPDYSILLIDNERENTTRQSNPTNNEDNELPIVPFRRVFQSFHGNLRNKVDNSKTTANDVANLLRSSIRRSMRTRTLPNAIDGSISRESLVNRVEPISNTIIDLESNQTENRDSNDVRCLSVGSESNTSVI